MAQTAREIGLDAIVELPGKGWKADVWIGSPRGPVVVECQHSYQHLREYITRQKRYLDAGIDCLWLVIEDAYRTLSLSAARYRLSNDLKGAKAWPMDQAGLIRDFPVGLLKLDVGARVLGPGLAEDLSCVIAAFVDRRFVYDRGRWLIDGHGDLLR